MCHNSNSTPPPLIEYYLNNAHEINLTYMFELCTCVRINEKEIFAVLSS